MSIRIPDIPDEPHDGHGIRIPPVLINAEFQRLLWLNLSWGAIGGILLVYVLFVVVADSGLSGGYVSAIGWNGILVSQALAAHLLHRSLKRDIESNTFDQLRMSSLSVRQMTVSRLTAAPINGWVCFAAGWLLWFAQVFSSETDGTIRTFLYTILFSLPLLMWAMLCLVLLNSLQFGRSSRQWNGSGIQVVLMVIVSLMFTVSMAAAIGPAADKLAPKFDNLTLPLSALLLAVFCSVAVHAGMAQRLHLRNVKPVVLALCLCSPVLLFWAFVSVRQGAWVVSLCYGCAALGSLVGQDSSRQVFERAFDHLSEGRPAKALASLPAWPVMLVLGLATAALHSAAAMASYIQIGIVMLIVLFCSNRKWRYNSITIALTAYLLLRMLWGIWQAA